MSLDCTKNTENYIKYNSFPFMKNNNSKERIINAPQSFLKKIQKRLLALLQPINRPAWVMFGEKGKSYINNAVAHQYNSYCVTMDIKGFYDHCSRDAVYRFCMYKLHVAPDVADIITDFTTWEKRIPTGSPVSQLLAYYAYEDMFCKINEYAKSIGAKFTLYVDDITISSKSPIDPKRIASKIGRILYVYGHTLGKNKTKYYSKSDFKLITGVTISPNYQLLVPNKLSQKIINELAQMSFNCQDFSVVRETTLRLNGLLQSARLIQPDYRHNL